MTVDEAARVLGISTSAVRNRLSRSSLESVKENGTVFVLLPPEMSRDVTDTSTNISRDAADIPYEMSRDVEALMSAKDETIRILREQLGRAEERDRENRRIIAGLVQRVPELEPVRAILYARVSTDEQAHSGYSLAQQIEALREYATREGYEVLEEVMDPGQSGASLERPGMDRVRDLVAAGGVSMVLVQDRDRIAREPAFHILLKLEFEEHGTRLKSLNDRGSDSPEDQLTEGILDQLAKFERLKTVERTRRGRMRKAKEGRLVGTAPPTYGFRYNENRDGFVVYEPEMLVVEKIFRLAAQSLGIRAIQARLHRDGVSTQSRKQVWDGAVIRRMMRNDVYKPHIYNEVREFVAPEVAARLDPGREYGIAWCNKQSVSVKTVSEPDVNGGRRYRKCLIRKPRPRKSGWRS